ncbi:MAG: hypothetical protein ACREAY_04295 [Nitrososphaera sp.]|uniref:hypothetical protein n=1 Tax=Nitrososphaera sp. TaxID=1971748 RepID=UPI003D6F66D0
MLGRGLSDTAGIAARGEWTWGAAPAPPPPGSQVPSLGMMMASNATVVKPMAGMPVGGTFTLLTASQLVSQLSPPALSISDWAAYPDLSKVAMVMPTYQVNLAPTPQLPGDDAMLSVRMARVPANMPVLMPIDLAGTPQTSEHGNVPWMKVEYTPGVDSTDFAMLVTIIDSQPAGAPALLGGVNALYVDFEWVGNFSGADPGSSGDYDSPPTFTFAISDAWASQQGVLRDSNGVPVMSLSVLDEAAGAWQEVSAVDSPVAPVDGQYVYMAHLEHFSTYAVTAGKAARGGGGQPPQQPAAGIVAQLVDSMAVGDAPQAQAVEFIDQFSKNKGVAVRLVDQLRITTKPVGYGETVLVGKDATARMTLESVETEEGAFGSAVAKVLVHMGNKGDKPELFVLDYFYIDGAGKKAYESSRTLEIAPGELKIEEAKIPFTKPGTYQLLMEVRSDAGALLGVMQVQVEVPWLAVNLYPLAAAVAVILVSTMAAMAVYASRRSKVLGG